MMKTGIILPLLAFLLTGSGCAYYSSNIKPQFMNHRSQFAASQSAALGFNVQQTISGGNLFFFGYSVQDGTYALSIRINVDDPQYTRVHIDSITVFPVGKTTSPLSLVKQPIQSEFEPFSYCTTRSGKRVTVERYGAELSVPSRLDTDVEGYTLDIKGHYELSNGTQLKLRILDYVTFVRDRDLVPMYKIWEQI